MANYTDRCKFCGTGLTITDDGTWWGKNPMVWCPGHNRSTPHELQRHAPLRADYLADMEVTYTDGHTEVIPNVRYQVTPYEINPIVVEGTTVEIEVVTGEVWTLAGVRKYRLNPNLSN